MSRLSFFVRGFNPNLWWFFYSHSKNKIKLIKLINTIIYMRIASNNGGINIGNNVKIGAGAIVVDNVPDNCTVVSEKSIILKK